MRKLVQFSFDLIQHGGVATFGRIPYLLIADLLEGQTIANAEILWDVVESSIEKLTEPESFRTGKNTVRTCKICIWVSLYILKISM